MTETTPLDGAGEKCLRLRVRDGRERRLRLRHVRLRRRPGRQPTEHEHLDAHLNVIPLCEPSTSWSQMEPPGHNCTQLVTPGHSKKTAERRQPPKVNEPRTIDRRTPTPTLDVRELYILLYILYDTRQPLEYFDSESLHKGDGEIHL